MDDQGGAFALYLPWTEGDTIPEANTCNGVDTSPQVSWSGVPADATSLALTVIDDTASGFVHWVVADIPPTADYLPDGATIPGVVQTANDFGVAGWRGPCPPAASGAHAYRFALFALNTDPGITAATPPHDAVAALEAAAIARAEIIATYSAG